MLQHKERRNDEIFVGNRRGGLPIYLQQLSTIRLGEQAFDIHEKKLPPEYRPMFVGKSEENAYNKIMMKETEKAIRGENQNKEK